MAGPAGDCVLVGGGTCHVRPDTEARAPKRNGPSATAPAQLLKPYHNRPALPIFAAVSTPPPFAGAILELPNQHRIPLTWLLENAGPTIRYRTYQELAPAGFASAESIEAAHVAITESKAGLAVVDKQQDDGTWGGNLMGLAASAAQGIEDIGTIPQYRRMVQLAWPRTGRPFKLADRVLFRLLSRDDDPALQFEYAKLVGDGSDAALWVRRTAREAATAALAEAGYVEDPRVRGAAHKIANDVSQFLRSPLAEKPFVKAGSQLVLHGEAHPPTWYSVAMLAAMPNLQRERAGFTERLGHYLAQPAPNKAYSVALGKKKLKPQHLLLGDPIEADAKGAPKDLPLALHYIELLARMGALHWAPVATKVLARLLQDCDGRGVWAPKNLRSQPKGANRITYHYYPLNIDGKTTEEREADTTFRLALIAKLLGWQIDYS